MPALRHPSLAVLLMFCLLAAGTAAAPAPAAGPTGTAATLRRALTPAGARTGASVRDLTTGRTLYASREAVPRVPASVEKLLTTMTALRRFGPLAELHTDVLATTPADAARRVTGDLVLVGGGDPTLDRAALTELADGVAASVKRVDGAIVADASLFDDRPGGPRTGLGFDSDLGGVLGALTIDRGFARDTPPALAAARTFARLLRARKVKVAGRTRTGALGGDGTLLARVASVPMAELVARTNIPSDNFYAETLLKALGARFGGSGTTRAGAELVRREARELGVSAQVADGSGLSRADRISPHEVVDLLDGVRRDPLISAAFDSSLAVAGRTGTLARRLRGTPAAGVCRGKTGTLDGVSTLAGYCTPRGAAPLAFAFMMSGVSAYRARRAQDRALVALVRSAAKRPSSGGTTATP